MARFERADVPEPVLISEDDESSDAPSLAPEVRFEAVGDRFPNPDPSALAATAEDEPISFDEFAAVEDAGDSDGEVADDVDDADTDTDSGVVDSIDPDVIVDTDMDGRFPPPRPETASVEPPTEVVPDTPVIADVPAAAAPVWVSLAEPAPFGQQELPIGEAVGAEPASGPSSESEPESNLAPETPASEPVDLLTEAAVEIPPEAEAAPEIVPIAAEAASDTFGVEPVGTSEPAHEAVPEAPMPERPSVAADEVEEPATLSAPVSNVPGIDEPAAVEAEPVPAVSEADPTAPAPAESTVPAATPEQMLNSLASSRPRFIKVETHSDAGASTPAAQPRGDEGES